MAWSSKSVMTLIRSPKIFRYLENGNLVSINLLPDFEVYSIEGARIGSWWSPSEFSLSIYLTESAPNGLSFRVDDEVFLSIDGSIAGILVTHLGTDTEIQRALQKVVATRQGNVKESFKFVSRLRAEVLPLSPLDEKHRALLRCMGLCVCQHPFIGRVLVSIKGFNEREVVIYSKVSKILDISLNEALETKASNTKPTCSYLHVVRSECSYHNEDFSVEDPILSGDVWYLVNHSTTPNLEIRPTDLGLSFYSRRRIKPFEPLTWRYPSGFFTEEDTEHMVDLPSVIVPEDID